MVESVSKLVATREAKGGYIVKPLAYSWLDRLFKALEGV